MDNVWHKSQPGTWHFEGGNLPDPKSLCFHPLDLPVHRNAQVRFSVRFHGGNRSFHAALCFRQIDLAHCYGVGLGGWTGRFSFFQFAEHGFHRVFMGDEGHIIPDQDYEFELEFRANRVEHFCLLGSVQTSIMTTTVLPHAYMRGGLGLYAYGGPTRATLRIKEYNDLGLRAFMVCGIDGSEDCRCGRIERIMARRGIKLEVIHANRIETYPGLMRSILDTMLRCDLVISWFTGEVKPNVAYETGIAHSLNIPTIHIVDDLKEVPSDLRSQFFITESDIERKLPMDVDAILERERNEVRYLL